MEEAWNEQLKNQALRTDRRDYVLKQKVYNEEKIN